LADIRTGKSKIRSLTGLVPNVLAIDFDTFESLREETTLLDKIKYTQMGVVSEELVARALGLEEVILLQAITSTAKEKKDGTDFTAKNIWEINAGKGMGFLFYRPRAP